MNIGIAQLNTTVGDVAGNLAKAIAAVRKCKADGADLVVFPELLTTGYPPKDLIYRKDLIEANMTSLQVMGDLSKELDVAITFGFIEPNNNDGEKSHFNSAATFNKGQLVNLRRKTLLPTYDVFNEDRYFEPGDPAREFAVGQVFELNGVKMCVIICEEAWNDATFWNHRMYDVDPVFEMAKLGAEYAIVINSSPSRDRVFGMRLNMMAAHCQRNRIECVYVNQVGYNDDVGFDGNSFAMNARGEVIHHAPSFMEDVSVFSTEGMPMPEELYTLPWQHETILALQCGVRDYWAKLGIDGPAILGLSGGIDSALVAYIATTALGPERCIAVAMPSEFSSEGSVADAKQIAKKLGIHFVIAPINPPHAAFRASLDAITTDLLNDEMATKGGAYNGTIFGRTRLPIKQSGVTDENIQARIRGVELMGLANYFNGIVLSTGNKSEMAVGYCTLYGDMCGGLAVISDLLKTKVFEVCRWINEQSRDEVIPWNTINKPPSAELRANQTDQQSLPPYDVLDEIIVSLVEENESPDAIAQRMAKGDYDRAMKYKRDTGRDLEADVYWVCQAVDRNEHKRKQAPTGLKLTKRMFKAGREYPIVHKLPVKGVVKHSAAPTFPLGGEKAEK